MTDFSDTSRLISNVLYGDERAVEELIRLYKSSVFRLALSILDDPAEAEDIAQESLVAALSALKSYQDQGTFKTWLLTITLNKSRTRLRSLHAHERLRMILKNLFQVQSQKPTTPEDSIVLNEKKEILWSALNNLKEKYRLPLLLRYYHNLSTTEIAYILNLNEGTVFSRLHTGRAKLRAALEKRSYFYGE
jgi:RNA polymerase sigma-70 factor (ECF subfamily)